MTPAASPPDDGFAPRAKILVVDDAPSSLQLLAGALYRDFDLHVATSGASALAVAREALPDLILLDIMMPDMDGYEVCRRLGADPSLREIPVILVSALADGGTEPATGTPAVAGRLEKPIDVAMARECIREVLARRRPNAAGIGAD